MRTLLLCALLAFAAPGAAQEPVVLSALKQIKATAAYHINDFCGPSLVAALRGVHRGENPDMWREELQNEGCFDRYSLIQFRPARLSIPPATVTRAFLGQGIDYVRVNFFAAGTPDEFRKLLLPYPPARLVLDLRGNDGGTLIGPDGRYWGALGVAELFAPRSGAPILTLFPRGKDDRTFEARSRGELLETKVVLLVDKDTASASELLAGAFKLWRPNMHIVGVTTYGKGVYQDIIPVWKDTSVWVTAGRFIAGNRSTFVDIDGIGIAPTRERDQVRSNTLAADHLVYEAKLLLAD